MRVSEEMENHKVRSPLNQRMALLMHTEAYKVAGKIDQLSQRCSCFCSNETDKSTTLGYLSDQLALIAEKLKERRRSAEVDSDVVPETPDAETAKQNCGPHVVSINPLIRGFKRKKNMRNFKRDAVVEAAIKFVPLYPDYGLELKCSGPVPFPSKVIAMAVAVVSEICIFS